MASQEYNKAYYKKNKEELLIKTKIWYQNNKEKFMGYVKAYNKRNPCVQVFSQIKQRCLNPNHASYKYYGGKGIKCLITLDEVKQLWIRDNAEKLNRPSIDRKESNKDYTFDNCRFIELHSNINRHKRGYKKDINNNIGD